MTLRLLQEDLGLTRLEVIKLEVAAGTYKVDPALVAEAILEDHHNPILRRTNPETQCEIRALDYEGVDQNEIAKTLGLRPQTVREILNEHVRPSVQVGRRMAA